MFLVSLKQRLSPSHIFGQFIGTNNRLGIRDPAHQIPIITEESMQMIRVIQQLLSLSGLVAQGFPVAFDLLLFGANVVALLGVRVAQALGFTA